MLAAVALLSAAQSAQPADFGIDQKALARLVQRCRETKSWSLVVLRDGKTVVNLNFGHPRPCNIMSATKSITGIAIGLLLDDGKIPSVETPVASILPEYRGKWKDKVTIEHLLTHSSGIELYDKPGEDLSSRVPAAIRAPVLTEPGTQFLYNNRAVDLLSGIVRKVSGMPLDEFLGQRLFKPLGITDYAWQRDPDGNPHGCAELFIRPPDLAKIGQMYLQDGVWEGKRILSADFVRRSTHANRIAQPYPDIDAYGWLWWISDPWMTLTQAGLDHLQMYEHVPVAAIRRLKPLVGKRWPSLSLMWTEMLLMAGPCPELWQAAATSRNQIHSIVKDSGGQDGYFASGWGGQYLYVLPRERLVAVRTLGDGFFNPKTGSVETGDFYRYAKLEMQDFYRLVRALSQPPLKP